ncbi:Inosine 5'-monophosphate dehydrogenase OS=Streptomyces lavendulae subsp. lavendulae OX=58340 GN=SLAV_06490 PE=4 SV=1 [Streptomyces lavendulae subsp. lavendulae]
MTRRVHEVMTGSPVTVEKTASLAEAARVMRDAGIGDVLVVDEGRLRGILTEHRHPRHRRAQGPVRHHRPHRAEPVTVRPDDGVDDAVALMRRYALRRLPVQSEDGELVGVVTLGDLAIEQEPGSALAAVSAADPDT